MESSEKTDSRKNAHRRVKHSTTLNRKYVKHPTKSRTEAKSQPAKIEITNRRSTINTVTQKKSPKVAHFKVEIPDEPVNIPVSTPDLPPESHPLEKSAKAKMKALEKFKETPKKPEVSAKELKERAIKKALSSANTVITDESIAENNSRKAGRLSFSFGRIVLALSCAATAILAVAYLVSLNMPDISLRVAAMQTGINATYPSYIPRDYTVSSITSENSKITLAFKNSTTDGTFLLIEESSSWDSNALLSNFVKPTYGENYSVIREQGITIYVNGSNAAWVNGDILYRIESLSGSLTNKQIRSIAVSL